MKHRIFGLLALMALSSPALAQNVLRAPLSFNEVRFFLHTVDVGPSMAEKYGHTQIRMVDPTQGQDVVFSWGLFDFSAPNFAWNFYKGILIYEIGAFPMARAMAIYRRDQRSVWEDELNLTALQKRRLFEKIAHDLKAENRSYAYQYFFDNCSTRPRDFIDHAVSGKFAEAYAGQLSTDSFRDMVREHQATTLLSGMALEILMNSRLDRNMTAWEEMFLPARLRSALSRLPAYDDSGQAIQGSLFLTFKGMLVEANPPRANYLRDDLTVWALIGVPLLFVLFSSLTGLGRDRVSRVAGLLIMVWGGLSGALATMMVTNWLVSDHLDLHHNANLLIFWPLDFVFVFIGWQLLRRRSLSPAITRFAEILAVAHMLVLCGAALAQLSGLLHQDLSRILLSFGIIAVGVYYLLVQRLLPKSEEGLRM